MIEFDVSCLSIPLTINEVLFVYKKNTLSDKKKVVLETVTSIKMSLFLKKENIVNKQIRECLEQTREGKRKMCRSINQSFLFVSVNKKICSLFNEVLLLTNTNISD